MKIIKIISYTILLLIVSSITARWLSNYASWWFSIFPKLALKLMISIVGPLFSKEAWEAEEQIDFLIFWVPSFLFFSFMSLPIFWIKNKFQKAKSA